MERFKAPAASMLILYRWNNGVQEILLQKRQNTGYKDGYYDLAASGHIEDQESAKMAMIREAKEELNIELAEEDVFFSSIVHKCIQTDDSVYLNFYFYAHNYSGTPRINEPHKCSEITWFPIQSLPEKMIADRKQAIDNYLKGIYYNEYGFGKNNG